jgi:hypothetical protein
MQAQVSELRAQGFPGNPHSNEEIGSGFSRLHCRSGSNAGRDAVRTHPDVFGELDVLFPRENVVVKRGTLRQTVVVEVGRVTVCPHALARCPLSGGCRREVVGDGGLAPSLTLRAGRAI